MAYLVVVEVPGLPYDLAGLDASMAAYGFSRLVCSSTQVWRALPRGTYVSNGEGQLAQIHQLAMAATQAVGIQARVLVAGWNSTWWGNLGPPAGTDLSARPVDAASRADAAPAKEVASTKDARSESCSPTRGPACALPTCTARAPKRE